MTVKNINISKKITFLLFAIFFLIGTITFKDYGISVDEEFQRRVGIYWLNYVLSFTSFYELNNTVAIKLAQITGFTLPNVEGNEYYGVIFDLPVALLEIIFQIDDPKNYFYFKHFLNFILFFTASIFFYKILLNRFLNYNVALIGTLFFVLSPRIYGHSFFNPKDMIFLSLVTIALYHCFKLFDKISYKKILIFSIFAALSASQRVYGIFLPLSFIGFYLLSILSKKRDLNYFPGILLFCASFIIFFIIFWPYLWSDPIKNFVSAYKYFSHHNVLDHVKSFFNGEYIKANSVPYNYIFTWILISTPILYTILFIIGYIQMFKRFFSKFINIKNNTYYYDLWRGVNEKKDLFVLFNITCIIFYLVLFNTPMLTGWRHTYFINIFFIYISTYAFYRMNLNFKSILKKKLLFSIVILYLIFITYKMIIYHPYQNIYFNSLFNKNVNEKFEIDYWGLSGKKFLEDILISEKDKDSITVGVASFLPLERSLKLLDKKDRKKIKIIGQEYQNADYLYSNFMSEVDKSSNDKYKIPNNFSKINELILDNIKVYEVYKKNN